MDLSRKRSSLYIKDDNDDEKLYTSKNKQVVAEVSKSKDKQVIIVVDDHDHDHDDDLDEDTEIELEVTIKSVRNVIDKTLKRYGRYQQYYIYAGVDSDRMELVDYHDRPSDDAVTLRLHANFGDFQFLLRLDPSDSGFVYIEIVQLQYHAAEIGTSNGHIVVGRTKVPIPKSYKKWIYVRDVIKTVGGEGKLNGSLEFELQKWKTKRKRYYDPKSRHVYECLDY
ncbi:hypothetical protein FRX31_028485 [Thalictrum thalictroides]|uniref:Uncharacterized protein n=1 Tax=Thalictrum thalictroides TaxID=46969 RepID=A0A7J6VCH5_THATH|nr:hypothetical protein FRX31_028485 [Thalictrum thalictroides]